MVYKFDYEIANFNKIWYSYILYLCNVSFQLKGRYPILDQ